MCVFYSMRADGLSAYAPTPRLSSHGACAVSAVIWASAVALMVKVGQQGSHRVRACPRWTTAVLK